MAEYILAIDQGTTSTRAMIFNHAGEVIAYHQVEHRQFYPQPGWVEHDPLEIWRNVETVIHTALAKAQLTRADVAAVGVTNQRETTLVWNKLSGRPYYPAIVWQDTRTDAICSELAKEGGQDRFRWVCPWRLTFPGPSCAGC
jgi:glycerol kinase